MQRWILRPIEIVGAVAWNEIANVTGRAAVPSVRGDRTLTIDGREWHRVRSLSCLASSWRHLVINGGAGVGYLSQTCVAREW